MRDFVIQSRLGRRPWLVLFVPGMALVALGVLILVIPQLLVAMVAALFMGVGALVAAIGWRLRSAATPPKIDFSRFFNTPQ